jgi:hypothetical protein
MKTHSRFEGHGLEQDQFPKCRVLSDPVADPLLSENVVAPAIEPETSASVAKDPDH